VSLTPQLPATGVAPAGQPLSLDAKLSNPSPGVSYLYTFSYTSQTTASTILQQGSSPTLITSVPACQQVQFTVSVTAEGCATPGESSVTVAATPSGPFVNQDTCDPTEQCGTIERPWCQIQPAIDQVDTNFADWQETTTHHTVIKVASSAKEYDGGAAGPSLRLRDGVDVRGGWTKDFSGQGGTTTLAGAPTLDPTLPLACLVSWPGDPPAKAALRALTIRAAAPAQVGSGQIVAALCVDSNDQTEADVSEVTIDATAGNFGDEYVGIFVHGAGSGKLKLTGVSVTTPPADAQGTLDLRASHALAVDQASTPAVTILGGAFKSRGALRSANPAGQTGASGGLEWRGGGTLSIQPVSMSTPHVMFSGGPTVGGNSYGIHVEGDPTVSIDGMDASGDTSESGSNTLATGLWLECSAATIKSSKLDGGRAQTGPEQGSRPLSAGIVHERTQAAGTLAISTSTLQGGTQGRTRVGLFTSSVDVTLTDVTATGSKGSMGDPLCAQAFGADLRSPGQVHKASITTGSFAGGDDCDARAGIRVDGLALTVHGGAKTPEFTGATSPPASPVDCVSAYGLFAYGPSTEVHLLAGTYTGGLACPDRYGVLADDALVDASSISATGSTAAGARRAIGIMIQGDQLSPHTISASTLHGGSAAGLFVDQDLSAGLVLRTLAGATITGTSAHGCEDGMVPGCSGSLVAAGLIVERPTFGVPHNDVKWSGGELIGGPGDGSDATSVIKSYGALLQGWDTVGQIGVPYLDLHVSLTDTTKITGNPSLKQRSTEAVGVWARGGNVNIRSLDLKNRQLIEGGVASLGADGLAAGVLLGGEVVTPVVCTNNTVIGNKIHGGDAHRVAGLLSTYCAYGTIGQNFLEALGGTNTIQSEGLSVGWFPGGRSPTTSPTEAAGWLTEAAPSGSPPSRKPGSPPLPTTPALRSAPRLAPRRWGSTSSQAHRTTFPSCLPTTSTTISLVTWARGQRNPTRSSCRPSWGTESRTQTSDIWRSCSRCSRVTWPSSRGCPSTTSC
jgi:hypothetical protein